MRSNVTCASSDAARAERPSRTASRSVICLIASTSPRSEDEIAHDVGDLLRRRARRRTEGIGDSMKPWSRRSADAKRAQPLVRSVEELHRERIAIQQAAGDRLALLRRDFVEAVLRLHLGFGLEQRRARARPHAARARCGSNPGRRASPRPFDAMAVEALAFAFDDRRPRLASPLHARVDAVPRACERRYATTRSACSGPWWASAASACSGCRR